MADIERESADPLTRMLASRWLRTLIAIAIFIRVLDVYCDAGMSFYLGFQAGRLQGPGSSLRVEKGKP
jgi:hypothetical protein